MTISTNYEARSARNVLIQTFSERGLAMTWARENSPVWPGLVIKEVTVTRYERWVWSQGANLQLVAS